MGNKQWHCIDAGSEYCPCYLAETMDCITCSHLKGKAFCDCQWRGVCIYQEFHFVGYKRKDTRQPIEVPIVERTEVGSKMIIYTLKVTDSLARQLKQPGSYIFIRNKEMNYYFDIPMSIMYVDNHADVVKIAVEIHGVKTKTIKKAQDTLLIRGPYWNGIFGLENLKQMKDTRCLIIARGIAQAPAALVAEYLNFKNNRVDAIIDQGSADTNLLDQYAELNQVFSMHLHGHQFQERLLDIIQNNGYDLVFISGSDFLQKRVMEFIHENFKNIKTAFTNNHEICCGEGVCGACIDYDVDGIPIRTCKAQICNYE